MQAWRRSNPVTAAQGQNDRSNRNKLHIDLEYSHIDKQLRNSRAVGIHYSSGNTEDPATKTAPLFAVVGAVVTSSLAFPARKPIAVPQDGSNMDS